MSAQRKVYTYQEVSEHNKEGDLWVVHDNKVLNVSAFKNHPGGPEVLYEHGGQDITKSFADIGHSVEAITMIKEYVIGDVDPKSPKVVVPKAVAKAGGESDIQSLLFPLLILFLAILGYFYL